MSPVFAAVYRTSKPEVIRDYRATCDKETAWRKKVVAYSKSHGFHAERVMVSQSAIAPDYLLGFILPPGTPIPTGWRRDRKGHYMPARKTAEGKEFAREFDAMRTAPDARQAICAYGFPREYWPGGHVYTFGIRVVENVMWLGWGADPEKDDEPNKSINREVFERVKMSEYYAMVEDGRDPFAPTPEDESSE